MNKAKPDNHDDAADPAQDAAVREHLRVREADAWVRALCADDVSGVRAALEDRPGRANQFVTQPRPWGEEMWMPLHFAADAGAAGLVAALLGRGVSPGCRTRFATPLHARATPLHLGAAGGHAAVVGLLLNAGAEPDVLDARQERPLHLAARFGHAAVVGALLEAGADPDARNGNGRTALHEAIRSAADVADADANAAALELIRAGADVAAACPKEPDARTPRMRCEAMKPRRDSVLAALPPPFSG